MGILYNVPDLKTWGIMFFILVVLIALNELGRETKWGGILLFVIVPVVLTIFVWPTTCAPGNEYGCPDWCPNIRRKECIFSPTSESRCK